MWLIIYPPKIFNPKIEEAFFCIRYSNSVTTNPIQSDVERSIPYLYQLSFDDILSKLSNAFTRLLKNFNPYPENIFANADCMEGYESDSANLFESYFVGDPNKPPNKIKHLDESNVKSFKDNGMDDNYNRNSYCDGSVEIPDKSIPQKAVEKSYMATPCGDGYNKPSYVVLVGDTVRRCNTKLYASLPLQNKFMVKQRVQDSTGATRIKLVLKSGHER